MTEYIERVAAIKAVEQNDCEGYATWAVKSIPAADVAPVVRCKDCKHGTRLVCDLAGNEYIECRHGNIAHRLDWFCADGAGG